MQVGNTYQADLDTVKFYYVVSAAKLDQHVAVGNGAGMAGQHRTTSSGRGDQRAGGWVCCYAWPWNIAAAVLAALMVVTGAAISRRGSRQAAGAAGAAMEAGAAA